MRRRGAALYSALETRCGLPSNPSCDITRMWMHDAMGKVSLLLDIFFLFLHCEGRRYGAGMVPSPLNNQPSSPSSLGVLVLIWHGSLLLWEIY